MTFLRDNFYIKKSIGAKSNPCVNPNGKCFKLMKLEDKNQTTLFIFPELNPINTYSLHQTPDKRKQQTNNSFILSIIYFKNSNPWRKIFIKKK